MAHPTRAATSRAATSRPAIGTEDKGRLHIDPALLDSAFDYQWVRETTLGEYDEGNIQMSMENRGFVPVEAASMKEIAPVQLPGRKAADTLIRRGGLILMKRAKEVAQDQRHAEREANDAAIAGVTKDLTQRMDGRNFQPLSDRPVTTAVDRRGPEGAARFAE
jgi:hypothetical protein